MGMLFVGDHLWRVGALCALHAQTALRRSAHDKSTRLRWLDLHNLIGIVTPTWPLTVGRYRGSAPAPTC